MRGYVDVHTHLIHPRFADDADAAAERARAAGVTAVIVNGLEPRSNRAVLELCDRHEHLHAALGIYPVDASAHAIEREGWNHPFEPPEPFDLDAEIAFIDAQADRIIAVGEVGLDRHWVKADAALKAQDHVLRRLCEVAIKHDLPVILHTRKAEQATLDILLDMGVAKADFHCYGGKSKLAVRIADAGFYVSIPPAVVRSQQFQSYARKLPLDRILTETDAPYMGPRPGERNEPAFVPEGVAAIAEARGDDVEAVTAAIADNFERLFGVPVPDRD